ncbi:MAG: hypothetical protein M3209_00220 [Acidobacteriota bacterium]|nr:hypothetical protein [Acidobacteriota bacterium]
MADFSLNLNGIIAILAILTTITVAYFANWWRNRKSLSYKVIYNTPLLTADEEIKEDLQISYKGNPVKNVHLFVLKIINDGNQPITASDFQKPLYFNLFGDVQILSAEVVSTNPYNLNPSIVVDVKRIGITPLLLNSKDFIKIKAIINAEKFSFSPDTRIIGVKEVKEFKDGFDPILYSWLFLMIVFGALLLAIFPLNYTGLIIYVVSIIIGFFYMRYELKSRRKLWEQFD